MMDLGIDLGVARMQNMMRIDGQVDPIKTLMERDAGSRDTPSLQAIIADRDVLCRLIAPSLGLPETAPAHEVLAHARARLRHEAPAPKQRAPSPPLEGAARLLERMKAPFRGRGGRVSAANESGFERLEALASQTERSPHRKSAVDSQTWWFHRLWTLASGAPDYDKLAWRQVRDALWEAGIIDDTGGGRHPLE